MKELLGWGVYIALTIPVIAIIVIMWKPTIVWLTTAMVWLAEKRQQKQGHKQQTQEGKTEEKTIIFVTVFAVIFAIILIMILFFTPPGVKLVTIGIILTLAIYGFHTVPKPQYWIIEFLGDYWTEWRPGPHILFPGIMKVKSRISMATQLIELYMDEENKLDFQDDSAPTRLRIKVRPIDAFKATYEIQISPTFKEKFAPDLQDWECAVEEQVDSAARGVCGSISIDDAISATIKTHAETAEITSPSDQNISDRIKEIVKYSLEKWGIILEDVLLTDIELNTETEKKRRELQHAKKDVSIAEQNQKKTVIDQKAIGMGEFEKIKIIADKLSLNPDQVIAYILTNKLYDDLKTATIIATSEGGALNVPVNVAATMAAIQSQISKGV